MHPQPLHKDPVTRPLQEDPTNRNQLTPLVTRLLQEGDAMLLRTDSSQKLVWVDGSDASSSPLQFEFDGVLAMNDGQQLVYSQVAQPLVDATIAGRSACLMCYGQTGTGKTYTFGGGEVLRSASISQSEHGVLGRALQNLMERMEPLGLSLSMCYVQVLAVSPLLRLQPHITSSMTSYTALNALIFTNCTHA